MSGDDKQLELEALAAVGEMLLFDQARGNPEEAARILRCARLFARSEDAAQRLSELCNEAGSDATWRENIVEELQDREDLQAAEAAMEARRQAQLVAQADSADTALQTLHGLGLRLCRISFIETAEGVRRYLVHLKCERGLPPT